MKSNLASGCAAALLISGTQIAPAQPGTLEFVSTSITTSECAGPVTLAVRRTGGSDGSVSVDFGIHPDSTAEPGDYFPLSGRIEFADGETGEKAFELWVIDDNAVEPEETVILVLTNPLGGAALGPQSTATVTIQDVDMRFSFGASSYQCFESVGEIRLMLHRIGRLNPVAVFVRTHSGTARAPADFEAVDRRVNFGPGEAEKPVTIAIRDDPWGEPDEEFTVAVFQPLPCLAPWSQPLLRLDDTATIRIADDDRPGSVDPGFAVGSGPAMADGTLARLESLLIQDDGKVVLGGYFDHFSGLPVGGIVRLFPDGSRDTSFDAGTGPGHGEAFPGVPGGIRSLALQSDGKLLVGGWFWSFAGHSRTGLARLHPDGSVDTSFDPGDGFTEDAADESVHALVLQPDGKILVAWARRQPYGGDAPPLQGLTRLLADGRRDAAFGVNGVVLVEPYAPYIFGRAFPEGVRTMALQPDGRIVLGGRFLAISGTPLPGLARLLPDGSVDPTFRTGSGTQAPHGEPPGTVHVIRPLFNWQLLVGGDFHWLNDRLQPGIARVGQLGNIDQKFRPQADICQPNLGGLIMDNPGVSGITDIAMLPVEGMIVVGTFCPGSGRGWVESPVPPVHVARLDYQGNYDPGFQAIVPARRVAVHTDGSIYVLGDFAPGIARLNGGQPLKLTAVAPGANGWPRLRITAPVEHTYLLLSSPDLRNWWLRDILDLPAITTEIEIPPLSPDREFFKVLAVEP